MPKAREQSPISLVTQRSKKVWLSPDCIRTQEKMRGQIGKLGALTGTCRFSYF